MSISRVNKIMKQIVGFSTAEKIELLRSILNEIVISEDYFSEDEVADIKLALNEVARGELVDLDEFREKEEL